jgi:putative FmdB family regulatory protein
MPLYEYHCPSCDQTVEVLLRTVDERAECPSCGTKKLEKLLSVAASPAISGGRLPTAQPSEGTCGRPQCGSGCMFG